MARIRLIAIRGMTLAVVIGLWGTVWEADAAPTTLRWKFKPGEVLRYESAQTTVSRFKDPSGQELTQTLTLTMDLTWKVKTVDPQGSASLTQTIDRIKTTATLPFGKFSYDSKETGDATGPAGPVFKMLIGAEFQFKMNAKGELSEIQLADNLLNTLRGDKQPAGAEGQFSEAGLKNMLVQMGLVLPEEPTDLAKPWSRKIAIPAGPNGETREIEQIYTLQAAGSGSKPVDTIAMTTSFQPIPPDPNLPVKVKTQEATGRISFDNTAGRIDSSQVTEKVELAGTIEGKEIAQSNETVTILTLQPGKTP